jgi:cyclic beta-1,2-glucan synthetase
MASSPTFGSPRRGTPGHPVEIRRLYLANRSDRSRVVEITTSAEVVLHDGAAHEAHPVFSKLFLQTDHDPGTRALIANRRPRGENETFPVLFFALPGTGAYEFESDRELYPGRSRLAGDPVPIPVAGRLTGSVGNVLDPALSFRRTVELEPGGMTTLTFLLGVAPHREEAPRTIRDLSPPEAIDEILLGEERRDREFVRAAGADPAEDEAFQALAGAALYGHPGLGASPETRTRAHHRSGLPRELLPWRGLSRGARPRPEHLERPEAPSAEPGAASDRRVLGHPCVRPSASNVRRR